MINVQSKNYPMDYTSPSKRTKICDGCGYLVKYGCMYNTPHTGTYYVNEIEPNFICVKYMITPSRFYNFDDSTLGGLSRTVIRVRPEICEEEDKPDIFTIRRSVSVKIAR